MFLYFFLCVKRLECGFLGVQSARKEHAKECPKRPVGCCEDTECDWQGEMKELKQHLIDAHDYAFDLRENGKFMTMAHKPGFTLSYWDYSVDDAALLLFKHSYDDILSFACCALDNNPRGTVTLRSNANGKDAAEITFAIESIRKYPTRKSRSLLPNKVSSKFFANNEFDVRFNL